MVIDLGDVDEGIQTFKIGSKSIELDIFSVCKRIADIKERHVNFTEGFWLDDIVEMLQSYGFDKCSTATALKFCKELSKLTDNIKKNIG